MAEEIERKKFAMEIAKKIPNKPSVSYDCIKEIINKKVLIYIPSFPATTVLIEEWDEISEFNIFITNEILHFKKMGYRIQNIGLIGDFLVGKPIKNLVITIQQIEQYKEQLTSSSYLKNRFTLIFTHNAIFDSLESQDKLNFDYFINHWLINKAAFTFGMTNDPTAFSNYLEMPNHPLIPFVHKSYLIKPFLKSMVETSQQVYYDSSSVDKEFLDSIRLSHSLSVYKSVEYLVNTGVFYSSLFTDKIRFEKSFISGKISALLSTLEKTSGFLTLIYIDDPIEKFLIYKILLHVSTSQMNQIEDPIDFNEIHEALKIYTENKHSEQFILLSFDRVPPFIKDRVIKETGTQLNIQFIHNVRNKRNASVSNIIVFNYIPLLTKDYRIFILPLSFKSLINQAIQKEVDLAKTLHQHQINEIRKAEYRACEIADIAEMQNVGVHENVLINETDFNRPINQKGCQKDRRLNPRTENRSKTFRYTVLSGKIDEIREKCKNKAYVLSISIENGKIILHSQCTIGKAITAVNLQNLIKEPVLIPKISHSAPSLYVSVDSFELCTLTSFSTMTNPKKFTGNCFLMATDKKISLFSFSNERNLLIEFTCEALEDFIILNLKRIPGKTKFKTFGNNEENENSANRDLEILKEFLIFSFCLKMKPRVYSCDNSEEIKENIANSSDIKEKCKFFSKIEWNRLTLSEFTDFEERFDIRISIPCFQPLSQNNYDFVVQGSLQNIVKDNVDSLSLMARNYYIESTVSVFSSLPVKLVSSDITLEPVQSLSLKEISEYFINLDFNSFYSIACLISRKGRFLISKTTKSDLEFISNQLLTTYCHALDKTLVSRFEPVDFKVAYASKEPLQSTNNKSVIRSVILTPLSLTFDYEVHLDSNRVLRHFDPEKFCKLLIRDENGKDKFNSDLAKNTDLVYEYFRNTLYNGFSIGLRKYFFLVMTTSQLKVHGSWFVTPYEDKNGTVIGADYIKSWIGSFQSIRNIGKYAARIGLALSSTTYTREVEQFVEIEDTVRNGYLFTDGVGLCSRSLATAICKDLGMERIPSAFQIRFAGYKGVIAVHPWLDNINLKNENPYVADLIASVISKNGNLHNDFKFPGLILRKSMCKFESSDRGLEIVTTSKSCDFYLNRQIIMMLEGLGVPSQVFINFQNKYIYDLLVLMHRDYPSFVKIHSCLSAHVSSDIPFYRKLQAPILARIFEELNTKANILIPQGRGAIGVVDELGILEEDQVFCMFNKRPDENMEGLVDYGSYVVPNSYCIVAKNPVMHPGDIRLVKCVDCPQLHYLKDLIVFSKKGNRPVFNQCSGSDLDGDIFYVSWAKALIPKTTFKPYNYTDSNALTKDRVLFSDIVNFFVRSMKYYQLGQIAHSYLALADQHTIFDEKALKLSEIFNKSIDYVKTGNLVAISDDLVPSAFPDFMERSPSYKSNRALGHLYRRSLFDLSDVTTCECYSCTMKDIESQCRWKEFILLGAGVKTREIVSRGPIDTEYTIIHKKYIQDILDLMSRHQIRTEEDLFCQKHMPHIKNELSKVLEYYSSILKGKDSLKMAAACSCNSFSGIEMLCSDSYKLKGAVKKAFVKDGTSLFAFNSKIHLIDHASHTTQNSQLGYGVRNALSYNSNHVNNGVNLALSAHNIEFFYSDSFNFKEVSVPCDLFKIDGFIASLDWKRKDIFKDFFNLILLSGIYSLLEIDLIFDLLISLNGQMNASSIPEFLRVAMPFSTDKIFKILIVLPLDLSLQNKSLLLKDKSSCHFNENYKPVKICKRICLIISGMLDENDDLEFKRKNKYFVPELRNKGGCSVDYYKDSLRDFIVNLLYSQENHNFLKNLFKSSGANQKCINEKYNEINCDDGNEIFDVESANQKKPRIIQKQYGIFELFFIPGEFYFTNIPATHINERISVKYLESVIVQKKSCKYEFEHDFKNKHDVLDENARNDAFEKISGINNLGIRIVLSFIYKETRYDLEYSDNQLMRISKSKKIIGTAYILNNSVRNDLKVQLFRKELIFDRSSDGKTLDVLSSSEKFMKQPLFFEKGNEFFAYPALKDQNDFTKIKLDVQSVFRNSDGFTMIRSKLFCNLSNDLFLFKTYKNCCHVHKEFGLESLDHFNFDSIYGKLWRLYNQVL